jgi:hypothetical protein
LTWEQAIRFCFYAVGFAFAGSCAWDLWRLGERLGRILAFVMVAWAFNCAVLAVMRLLNIYGQDPGWREWVLDVNSVLLVAVPVVVHRWLNRNHG